uniref:BTB domain-containing protein n=1 Tax=Panagrellus redivivus TaxID=6233 RepID=A0A7E4UYW6_PANRE
MPSSFTDTAEVKVSTADIDGMTEEQCVFSTKHRIRGSKIQWAVHVCGVKGLPSYNPRIFLWVSEGGLTAKGNVVIGPVDGYEKTFSFSFNETETKHCIVDGFRSSRLGEDGVVTVHVTFSNYKDVVYVEPSTVFDFITDSSHYTSDAQIHVDDKTIDVHRHFLCMISPVFHAEFTHDTKEARSGTIEINDFSFDTVKKVIDYCYGREFVVDELSRMIDVLKFADKYDIKTVIKKFDPL